MSAESLADALATLRTPGPGSPDAFEVSRTRWGGIFVGRGRSGFTLLAEVAPGVGRSESLRTNLLVLQSQRRVTLISNGVGRHTICAVLQFPQDDPGLFEFGLVVAEMLGGLFSEKGESRTAHQCFAICTEFLALLSLPPRPALEVILGVLGELLFIERVPDTRLALQSWRVRGTSRFDFNFPRSRVEVKASRSRSRVHHVSYDQTNAAVEVPVLFASVLLEEVQVGRSGADVFGAISTRLGDDGESRSILTSVVATTCGEGVGDLFKFCFDGELALQEMMVFDSRVVPSVAGPLSPGVSQVRFRSDFSLAPSIEWSDVLPVIA